MSKSGFLVGLLRSGLSRPAALAIVLALCGAAPAASQTEEDSPTRRIKIEGEALLHVRNSSELAFRLNAPRPPEFLRPGEDALFLRTPDAGTSLELSRLALTVSADLTPHIAARLKVHAYDLYSRNPSSIADRLFVREAWGRFGHASGTLDRIEGPSLYALFGLAPRFTKPDTRQLESYGLWSTAVGRFEQMQLQLGGTLGRNVYWRIHGANRNPVFFRDTNALAADNGTPERVPGNVNPIFESGFPILYDTLPSDVNFRGTFEWGGGIGARLLKAEGSAGVDVLGWYFTGDLADQVRIRGTFYSGDIGLLEGNGVALGFSGDRKTEYGVNVTARVARLRAFGQYVVQEIAGLERQGFEGEFAWRFPLGGLLVSGDEPVFNWLSLAFRFSNIDNRFPLPPMFVAPSLTWDWRKYDIGARLGIVRNVDLTAEFSRHDMITARGTFHPDEALVSLRVGF